VHSLTVLDSIINAQDFFVQVVNHVVNLSANFRNGATCLILHCQLLNCSVLEKVRILMEIEHTPLKAEFRPILKLRNAPSQRTVPTQATTLVAAIRAPVTCC